MKGEQQFRPEGDGERGRRQAQRLVAAYEQLETALEAVDVERDPAVADAVIEAVSATDRAYHLALSQSRQ